MNVRSYHNEILPRLKAISDKFNLFKIGDVKFKKLVYPLYCVHAESQNLKAKEVFLSAGVHGNESAPVYALLEFLEEKIHDYLDCYSFVISPCLNPGGFEMDTRENFNKVNLNRNFLEPKPEQEVALIKKSLADGSKRFLFAVDMHADPSDEVAKGYPDEIPPEEFYMYEISSSRKSRMGHKIIKELEKKGVNICKRKYIYGDKNENGLIWSRGLKDKDYKYKSSLEAYLQKYYTSRVFTVETPTCWSFECRIATHLQVLSIMLEKFKNRKTKIVTTNQ